MVKGHNKGKVPPQNEHKGGDEHLKEKEKKRKTENREGRNKKEDQSGGTKGKNSIK